MKGVVILVLLVFLAACTAQVGQEAEVQPQAEENEIKVKNMKLTSPAFEHEGNIPSEFTCDSSDISPELEISDVRENTKSLALVMDDPDAPAGKWDHWIIFNIPQDTKKIEKGTEPEGIPGKNSWGKTGYGGPCPPSGTHRYFFKLFALDTELDLPEGSTKQELEEAMQNHLIEETQLIGKYQRG